MAEAPGFDLHLHPLVMINVSDNVVRFRCSGRNERPFGLIIGQQEGRRVDLHNSYELIAEQGEGGERAIDLEFYQTRSAQYLEVFPRYEVLGWYSTGATPSDADKVLHKKIQEMTGNDNPFLLLLDTEKMMGERASQSEELPVKVYDSLTHVTNSETVITWKEAPYIIDTEEAERVSVSHVAKAGTTSTAGGHSSDFTQHAGGLGNSVLMLSNRVKELLEYAEDVKAGRAPKNHAVLRELLSICEALRATHPDALQRQYCSEFNDAALVVLLASLTKACANTSDLLDKFQLAHDKKHRQRHPYPWG